MNRKLWFFIALITLLLIQACALMGSEGKSVPVPPIKDSNQQPQSSPAPVTPTKNLPLDEFRLSEELNQDILQEVTFFAGGAGCGAKNIGVSDKYCATSEQWPITLKINGVFRDSDQGMVNFYPWWGDKYDSCYETLRVGDMVYFSAFGYLLGEPVEYTIQGPTGTKTYQSKVQKNVEYSRSTCELQATAPAARLSWVVDPELGVGNYTVTVDGKAGKASLNFVVAEADVPSFGISVGTSSLPLVFGPERTVNLVYSNFQPNQVVTTLVYNPKTQYTSDADLFSRPVRYINVQMDQYGTAVRTVKWDTSLPPGWYWFLVPGMLPDKQPNQNYSDFPIEPALWGIYSYFDIPPEYNPEE